MTQSGKCYLTRQCHRFSNGEAYLQYWSSMVIGKDSIEDGFIENRDNATVFGTNQAIFDLFKHYGKSFDIEHFSITPVETEAVTC